MSVEYIIVRQALNSVSEHLVAFTITYYIYRTVTCNNFIINISLSFSLAQYVSALFGHLQVLLSKNFHTAYVVIKRKMLLRVLLQ
jgi:hypothetical protein